MGSSEKAQLRRLNSREGLLSAPFDTATRIAVDVAVLSIEQAQFLTLLYRRRTEPFSEHLAIPGVLLNHGESLADAVLRAVSVKARLRPDVPVLQLAAADVPGAPDSDQAIRIAYCCILPPTQLHDAADAHAALEVCMFDVPPASAEPRTRRHHTSQPVSLAFDHGQLLLDVVGYVRQLAPTSPIALDAMEPQFTLRELQTAHELLAGKELNKDSFRRSIKSSGLVVPTGVHQDSVDHRPAELYRRHLVDGSPRSAPARRGPRTSTTARRSPS